MGTMEAAAKMESQMRIRPEATPGYQEALDALTVGANEFDALEFREGPDALFCVLPESDNLLMACQVERDLQAMAAARPLHQGTSGWLEGFLEAVSRLQVSQFVERCRPAPESGGSHLDVRELPFGRYRMLFYVDYKRERPYIVVLTIQPNGDQCD